MRNPKDILKRINELFPDIESDLAEAGKRSLCTQKFVTPGSRLYLRGSFVGFEHEQQSLCIKVEGELNYYPLNFYHGEKLPFPGSPVLIFSESMDDKLIKIIGFDKQGKKIGVPQYFQFKLKGIHVGGDEIILQSSSEGVIKMSVPNEMLGEYSLHLGEDVVFKRVAWLPRYYFIPLFKEPIEVNRYKILESMR